MAKKARWSVRADQDRLEIFDYWLKRNKSATYSTKLAQLFAEAAEKIVEAPEAGLTTKRPFIRRKVVRDYFMYYEITPDYIEILAIWDTRRNPKKFKL